MTLVFEFQERSTLKWNIVMVFKSPSLSSSSITSPAVRLSSLYNDKFDIAYSGALQREMIIPRDKTPDRLEAMSAEELRNLVRQQVKPHRKV